MSPESDEATPISDEELAAAIDSAAAPPRKSVPPPLPPDARRRTSGPVPSPGRGSTAPPPVGQSGTFRIPVSSPPGPAARSSLPPPPMPHPVAGPAEPGALRAELAEARGYIARLRLQVRQREDRIRELERAATRQQQELELAQQQAAELEAELVRLKAGGGPQGDDLKRIPGVGPSFEHRLHELGITRFAQIAAWSVDDVKVMAEHLNVPPNRILRDAWVEHAQQLLAQVDELAGADCEDG